MSESQKQVLSLLKKELSARRARNSRYSLRSYANSLRISHSLLSLVLSGKRTPSDQLFNRVQESLGKWKDSDPASCYHNIDEKTFSEIATWIHFALLGLVSIKPFSASPVSLSKKLGVTPAEARRAWGDLLRMGLVKKIDGNWSQSVPAIEVRNPVALVSGRVFNRQLLAKAEASMDNTRFDSRDITSIVFPMQLEDMPLAKERIKKFRRSLCKELEKNRSARSEVYAMTVQLFPLTQNSGVNV